ncbi:tetratricopeptide repeat protein [Christiangramia sabulilitoris]|uniref:Tetratricopeptide repeat protein n=1 Tax=Christiangramia sabulilitoris TaxID=2583991 RepID=A0A550I410_9FLAO|nr:tetratricopeptide repeat protein [Christiangramia sabulilitoris]TRO65712.1 tetratricopeptide repeat protein [Christiangramia sabulilitoris]
MLINFQRLLVIFGLIATNTMAQKTINNGEKLLRSGEIEEAREIFVQHKDNPQALEYLGDIASFNKNWEEAIKNYKTLVEIDPDNAMYNFKLGGALGMKAYYGSKIEAAMVLGDVKKYLRNAADLDAGHLEARRALVEFYMQIPGFLGGSESMAKSYASDLDRLNEVDAHLADAYIYKVQEYEDLAKLKYEEAIAVASRNPEHISRNYLNYELGEASAIYEIRLEDGARFLKNYIDNYSYLDIKSPAWAFFRLAQIERMQKNEEKALILINKSLEYDPEFDKALIEKQRIQRL